MTIVLSLIYSILTYELSKLNFLGAVRASALLGCSVYFLGKIEELSINPNILYGATFVGMTASTRLNRVQVLLASLAYFGAITVLSNEIKGAGGLLGFSAFLGVGLLVIFTKVIKK